MKRRAPRPFGFPRRFSQRVIRRQPVLDGLAVTDDDAQKLLKSCAIPPDRRPTASIFCDCRSCCVPPPQQFFRLLAFGNIAADDYNLFNFAPMVSSPGCAWIENAPLPVFPSESIPPADQIPMQMSLSSPQ